MTRRRRVAVVAAGSLASCPRAVKAADAFAWAGWDVRVVNAPNAAWASPFDADLHARRRWRWEPVDVRREAAPVRWLAGGVRHRAARWWSALPEALWPRSMAVTAFSRVHGALVAALLREPQDLIYGGTTGALAAIAEAARRSGAPCGLDFEDLHCAQGELDPEGARHNRVARVVMAAVAPQAAFLTGGSAAIAAAASAEFGVPVLPLNNVFPLAWGHAPGPTAGPLKLYWFSQTISAGRGLDEVVEAAGRLEGGGACELHLRGTPHPAYVQRLQARAARVAPRLRLEIHPPAHPDAMVAACGGFDAGLSTEQTEVRNRGLALSNKSLTYPLAGLAMVVTETPGQQPLADDLGEDVVRYRERDIDALVGGLARWVGDRPALTRAREAAWEAARRRWHWEHPQERDALLAAAERVL